MARGWESKSVESQQQDATTDKPKTRAAEDPAKRRERDGLLLARKRLENRIALAENPDPRYAQLLRDAISELDKRIAKLQ